MSGEDFGIHSRYKNGQTCTWTLDSLDNHPNAKHVSEEVVKLFDFHFHNYTFTTSLQVFLRFSHIQIGSDKIEVLHDGNLIRKITGTQKLESIEVSRVIRNVDYIHFPLLNVCLKSPLVLHPIVYRQ